MKLNDQPPVHLTYCLNIHPGETLDDQRRAILDHVAAVRDAVAGDRGQPFGLGLRLSAVASGELLDEPGRLDELAALLDENGMYAFTINGFPYGPFHGRAVKQNVYAPDWRSDERLSYTRQLATILARLLPEGVPGSISTVPGSYRPWIAGPDDVRQMAEQLARAAATCHQLLGQTGRDICIALEPEPDCFIETIDQAVAFFQGPLQRFGPAVVADALAAARDEPARPAGESDTPRSTDDSGDPAADILRRHLGLCLDTAHAAVQFESPASAIDQLTEAGVRLAKIQLSAALAAEPTAENLARLRGFDEPVYLHQVKARGARGVLQGYPDLPAALASAEKADPVDAPVADKSASDLSAASDRAQDTPQNTDADHNATAAAVPGGDGSAGPGAAGPEWRVHFHVPLFLEGDQGLRSTASQLRGRFAEALAAGACANLEIETYTFDVLPEAVRPPSVTACIAAEYRWVLDELLAPADA